jgi:hypothetical protein
MMKTLYLPSLLWIFLVLHALLLPETTIISAFVLPHTLSGPPIAPQFPRSVAQGKFCLLSTNVERSGDDSSEELEPKALVTQATIDFNNKLNRMARNFDKHSAENVEKILKEMMERIDMGLELEIQPNVVTFTAAISAWARSSHKNAPQRAEAILKWMIELSQSDDNLDLDNLKPNRYAYNAAIRAWIRSRERRSHNHAERLMNQLWDSYVASDKKDPELKPNASTFNLVINAIARSREPGCADKAAALMDRMEELYTAGDDDMEPDALTFGAIINAYANTADADSSDKAAQILQRMESLYQLGYKGVKPNTFVYNACLNAFAKNSQEGGNVEQASRLLELMEKQYFEKGDRSVKPDVITYSTCINAHANSRAVDAGLRADILMRRMTNLYLQGDDSVKPNAITYTACIKAWMAAAESNPNDDSILQRAAERAEELLQMMSLQYLAGDFKLMPTKITLDLVREAMSNVEDQEGIHRVEALRKRILETRRPRRESL